MKLSVAIITYNQEEFIAQAIDSALMQRTEFDYEIVIGEDCSTDKTREIVTGYQRRYPGKVSLLLHEKNLGANHNFVQTLSSCRGRYIALLEGDDYWTDSHKLQKQVNFMEAHPECSMCFHDAYTLYPDGSKEKFGEESQPIKPYYELPDILERHFIPTCSVVLRNGLFGEFPKAFYQVPAGDMFLFVLLAEKGSLGYVPEVWGIRRVHPGGVYSMRALDEKCRQNIKSFELINAYLGCKYEKMIRPQVSYCWYVLLRTRLEGEIKQGSLEALYRKLPQTLEAWLEGLPPSRVARRHALGEIYLYLARLYYRAGDRARTGACLMRGIRHNPDLLANRRRWSAGMRMLLVQMRLS